MSYAIVSKVCAMSDRSDSFSIGEFEGKFQAGVGNFSTRTNTCTRSGSYSEEAYLSGILGRGL